MAEREYKVFTDGKEERSNIKVGGQPADFTKAEAMARATRQAKRAHKVTVNRMKPKGGSYVVAIWTDGTRAEKR